MEKTTMKIDPKRRALSACLACGWAAAAAPAGAASVNPFEPSTMLQGTTLRLNGSGTRYRLMFKVYDLGLYLPRRATTPEEAIDMAGPKRLAFVALRELPGTDLGVAFIKGLQANNPADLVQRHAVSSARLIDIFSGKSKLVSGDTFAMDFVPGKGTQFLIQGQPQGAPVGDAEFFAMVLRIWLGPQPADRALRDALLAGA
ncbi:MAG: chalcone isomerase family protein [Burkholderiales bacterium]|nr:chalcone isomerase family protein [Burkholderiales bacterium]